MVVFPYSFPPFILSPPFSLSSTAYIIFKNAVHGWFSLFFPTLHSSPPHLLSPHSLQFLFSSLWCCCKTIGTGIGIDESLETWVLGVGYWWVNYPLFFSFLKLSSSCSSSSSLPLWQPPSSISKMPMAICSYITWCYFLIVTIASIDGDSYNSYYS